MSTSQALPLNNPPSWKHDTNKAEEAMNMYRSPSRKCQGVAEQDDKGFTLIEILIAIVLVGILSAVAVVGISNLVSKGTKTSCTATQDSATAASAVYFASTGGYPQTFAAMLATTPPTMTLAGGVTNPTGAPTTLTSGTAWTLTLTPGTTTAIAPTFSGCP